MPDRLSKSLVQASDPDKVKSACFWCVSVFRFMASVIGRPTGEVSSGRFLGERVQKRKASYGRTTRRGHCTTMRSDTIIFLSGPTKPL